jgi:hypothetical protein
LQRRVLLLGLLLGQVPYRAEYGRGAAHRHHGSAPGASVKLLSIKMTVHDWIIQYERVCSAVGLTFGGHDA